MFENEIPDDVVERFSEPAKGDQVGAKYLLDALAGKPAPDDLDSLKNLDDARIHGGAWHAMVEAVTKYAINRRNGIKPSEQRVKYLNSMFRDVGRHTMLAAYIAKKTLSTDGFRNSIASYDCEANARYIKTVLRWVESYCNDYDFPVDVNFNPFEEAFRSADEIMTAPEVGSDWLADGVVLRGAPMIFGGPEKVLKTQIAMDLLVSLYSGSPFLGRFGIPQLVRGGIIAGEDDDARMRSRLESIKRSKGLERAGNIQITYVMPNLGVTENLDALCSMIAKYSLSVIVIDPVYMAFPAGEGTVNHNNLFSMGNMLAQFSKAILGLGCTPILLHHFHSLKDECKVPGLPDLAHAGVKQFARQWILLNRRKPFVLKSAYHELHMVTGSYGRSDHLHLNVSEAVHDDGVLGWNPQVTEAVEEKPARSSRKPPKATPARDDPKDIVVQAIEEHDGVPTVADLRKATGMRKETVETALAALMEQSVVLTAAAERPGPHGQTRTHEGYILATTDTVGAASMSQGD